jgi:GRASP55/65 PDZ-like domain
VAKHHSVNLSRRYSFTLHSLLIQFLRRPLRFWVYNSTHDIIRVVTIVPDRSWGGDGAMGFNIGYGYLHRIPSVSSNEVVFDSEVPMPTAFELAQQQQPQQVQEGQSRPSLERPSGETSRPPTHGRRRASHSGKKVFGIEAILREGQEKSEKEDFVPSTTTEKLPPPPPPKRSNPVDLHDSIGK